MSEILRIIAERHPLEMDHESDARYIWPKRWAKVAEQIAELDATRDLLTKLVRGIEYWASQEDGLPDEIRDAYAQAKGVIGEAA